MPDLGLFKILLIEVKMRYCPPCKEKKPKCKPFKNRPGPNCKRRVREILPPKHQQHSPLKLTIKRLSSCHEPAFEVVNKKKGRVKAGDFAAMDDMIPDGRGIVSPHSQTPSPTPSEILRQEGFLAPEASEKNEEERGDSYVNGNPPAPPKEAKRGKNVKAKDKDKDTDKKKEKQQEDSGLSSNSEPEPSETPQEAVEPPAPPDQEDQSVHNGNAEMDGLLNNQKSSEQESSDSGCEKDGSETEFASEKNKELTPPPTPANPSPVGSLTILNPSALNNSIVNGSLPPEPLDSNAVSETFNSLDVSGTDIEQPLPTPAPLIKEGLTIKSPAALGATITPNLLNLPPNTEPDDPLGLLRGYPPLEPEQRFMMETCEVCGERSENLEQHKAAMGHYKCHMSADCAVVLFTSATELTNHQRATHGISPTPQPSLQQLQQQVKCNTPHSVLFTSTTELGNHQRVTHGMSPTHSVLFTSTTELSNQQRVTPVMSPTPQLSLQQPSLQQLQQQVQRLPVPYGIPAPAAMGTPPPALSPSPGYRMPSGITLSFPGTSPVPSPCHTPPQTPLITARPFALQTSPSTIQPDGSPVPVASPTLPSSLGRSISISPSVKSTQKRSTPSPAENDASKRSRPDSPDCMLVEDGSSCGAAPQKMPSLPSGISLTVRGSGNKESSGVANILASRGITVTPAANKAPAPPPSANRTSASAQPVTTLNLSSAVSIVPASQARSQFAVPQGRSMSRQAVSSVKPPTVDLTQDTTPTFRRRPQRFTCQFCDKVFTSQETLNTHLATHRSPGKLPYKCNLCNAQYPTQQAMLQHKQNYHKEAQGSEMALPVVDMKNPGTIQKLTSLGIRHCLVLSQLTNSSGGVFGLPIVAIDNARNPAVCNLGALGASNVLSLGPAKALR